ncbi:MAG: putative DNA binding domain-containing protein [Gemmatimonadota bacterium]|nr:putative DNA binding domain-containing protein [Gemmatimonadota bacterium]
MSAHLTKDEIPKALAQGEGQFREFKSAWNRASDPPKKLKWKNLRDKIADVVAAFANADGGLLFVGVEDDGRPSGHSYDDDAVQGLLAVPENRLRPEVRCRTGRVAVDGKEVLVFEVPQSIEAIMVVADGFPFRVGAQILREPQELINQRKQALRVVGYEQRFRAEATLDVLDLELAQRFLDRTPVGERPVEEALEYYGLIEKHLGQWKISNAGLLLFARRPALKWHPRAGVRVFRVAGTERLHGRRRNVTQAGRADPPLVLALEESRALAGAQVRQGERLKGLYFEGVPEYPEFAWQEALVNAIAHRDYEVTSRETEVWFYDDRVEISNPGDLIAPVTLERLREGGPAHGTRNPMLVRVLADIGAMRDEGEGIARVFDEMADRRLPHPEIECEGSLFTIRLFGEGTRSE